MASLPGESELALAVRRRHVGESARLLSCGADPNEEDSLGETPLYDAATLGHLVLTALLLGARADPLLRSKSGLTAADFANGPQVAALIGALSPPEARRRDPGALEIEDALRGLPAGLRKCCRDRAEEVDASCRRRRAPPLLLAEAGRLCAKGRPGVRAFSHERGAAIQDQGVASRERAPLPSRVRRAEVLRDILCNAKPARGPVGVSGFREPALDRAPSRDGDGPAEGRAGDGGGRAEATHAGGLLGLRLPCGLSASEVADLLFREITPEDYDLLLLLDEGVQRPTAGQSCVDALPLVCPREASGRCAVCFDALGEEADEITEDRDVRRLPCSHLFHHGCIARWLGERSRSCPVCTREVCFD